MASVVCLILRWVDYLLADLSAARSRALTSYLVTADASASLTGSLETRTCTLSSCMSAWISPGSRLRPVIRSQDSISVQAIGSDDRLHSQYSPIRYSRPLGAGVISSNGGFFPEACHAASSISLRERVSPSGTRRSFSSASKCSVRPPACSRKNGCDLH